MVLAKTENVETSSEVNLCISKFGEHSNLKLG